MKILIFCDPGGLRQAFKCIDARLICGVVGASIRPQQHAELRNLSAERGIPFMIQPRRSDELCGEYENAIEQLRPDIMLSNSYSMLISKRMLDSAGRAAINVHGALLPQYRGCNPIQWAIINNEKETGVTMHYMNERIDAGDIIAQRKVPIHETDTWLDVRDRICEATLYLLSEEMPRIVGGTNGRLLQDESKASQYPRRRPEDGLIDWEESARQIYNKIRALVRPHPGAFYYDGDGNKVTIDYYMSCSDVEELQKRMRLRKK